jgi:protein tyrosine phosphatase
MTAAAPAAPPGGLDPALPWRELASVPDRSAAAAALRAAAAALAARAAAPAGARRAEWAALQAAQERMLGRYSFRAAMRHKAANRYRDVLPYDHARVRLGAPAFAPDGGPARAPPAPPALPALAAAPLPARPDYVNASPVSARDAAGAPRWRYLLAQGPLPATVPAFARALVEQRVHLVVMLTRCAEGTGAKCAPYFAEAPGGAVPLLAPGGAGAVATLDAAELAPALWRRRLRVALPPCGGALAAAPAELTHWHYAAWPDHGVPRDPSALLALCALVRADEAPEAGAGGAHAYAAPVAVHCSAGIGRSGVYAAVDVATRRLLAAARDAATRGAAAAAAEAAAAVNVRAIVEALRHQRGGCVQTREQFEFCHAALESWLAGALAALGDAGGAAGAAPGDAGGAAGAAPSASAASGESSFYSTMSSP